MFNSSPITTWDGAGVFYSFADGGVMFWFWVSRDLLHYSAGGTAQGRKQG